MIRLIIFDFDGVLCPLNYHILMEVYEYIAHQMKLPIVWGKTVEEFRTWFSPKYPYNLKRMGSEGDEQLFLAEHLFREYLNRNGHTLFPMVKPILCYLRRYFFLSVVSNGPEVRARQQLQEMAEWFSGGIIGKETLGKRFKPDPYGILLCMRNANVSPEETLLIGDDPSDIVAGKNAGIKSKFGVAWGMGTANELYQAGADGVFEHIQDIFTLSELVKDASYF